MNTDTNAEVKWAMDGHEDWHKYESDLPVYGAWLTLRAEVERLRVNNEQLRDACADHLLRFGRLHDEADKYQVRALEAEAEVLRLNASLNVKRETIAAQGGMISEYQEKIAEYKEGYEREEAGAKALREQVSFLTAKLDRIEEVGNEVEFSDLDVADAFDKIAAIMTGIALTPEPTEAVGECVMNVDEALETSDKYVVPSHMELESERLMKLFAAEVRRLRAERDTPHTSDFLQAVELEALHQRARWGADHDAGKTPADWFWLLGYLSGKALGAAVKGDRDKAMHHTVSSAAALLNWHASLSGVDTSMRPGIATPEGGEP